MSKRLAAANADAKRKKDAYEAAAATAARLEQEKKELHEHLAMMVLSSEQRKEDKLKELLGGIHSECDYLLKLEWVPVAQNRARAQSQVLGGSSGFDVEDFIIYRVLRLV